MAILNITPDSFSGDGLQGQHNRILQQAEAAVAAGATLLDIGGESTRPGATPVSLQQELDRVIPVVEALAWLGVPLSVDTWKPEVMKAAIAAGASLINDINGFRAPGAIEAVANSPVGLCLMHMQGQPQTMQQAPQYQEVVAEVCNFLQLRIDQLFAHGVTPDRITVDPGFGFGKTLEHNVSLFRQLPEMIQQLGYPVLIGVSRKSMIGTLTGRNVDQRVSGSITAAVLALEKGARIVRVHDVAATVDAVKIWQALHH
jgi:dihydropteroate synthase